MTTKISVLWVTCPTEESAEEIGRSLLEKKLGACVQIEGPIRSLYPWKGQLQQDSEWRLWIKTKSSLNTEIIQEICQLHPFEVPQILSMPIGQALPAYEKWLLEQTKD
ncbi:MAG: divalent-cation tolerance protein CutA [Bradymonadales bacterium]|nr:MAG: divalent-cation tolerance protein CutA [Bradymonadales bacterium]